MAGSTQCVSCAGLPMKNCAAAAKVQQCPHCHADVGVTSYGVRFRAAPSKAHRGLTAAMTQNVLTGAAVIAVLFALAALGLWMRDTGRQGKAQAPPNPPFNPLAVLDRHPAVVTSDMPAELRRTPEVALTDFPLGVLPNQAKDDIRRLIGRIRQENAAKKDGFLLAQMQHRPEIRGLPYLMGDACKLDNARGTAFQQSVLSVRSAMDANRGKPFAVDIHSDSGIAALTQILGPESADLRTSFAKQLAKSQNAAASRELAKAAIFDSAGDVRIAALKALQGRPAAEYREVLLHGMRYPIPAVAKRTAQAIITLERTDLLPQLADMLGEAAPGDPALAQVDNVAVHVVREVVRINHHRNCLLCHAPVDTGDASEVPAIMPYPNCPFPVTTQEYYGNHIVLTEPSVRADTTYLRQDFSMMLKVADAAPWPEMQRFDFLVRTRVVEGKELTNRQAEVAARAADYLSENQKAALAALRELTGQDAAPNPAAWRRVIGQN